MGADIVLDPADGSPYERWQRELTPDGVVADASSQVDIRAILAEAPDLIDELFRHWPAGAATPRLEPLSPEEVLSGDCTAKGWDAAVLALPEHAPDSTWLRVADALQQALVPLKIQSDPDGEVRVVLQRPIEVEAHR